MNNIQQNFKQDCKDSCPSVEHVRTLSTFISVALFVFIFAELGCSEAVACRQQWFLLWLAADDVTVETYCYGNQPVLTTGLRGVYSYSTHIFALNFAPDFQL